MRELLAKRKLLHRALKAASFTTGSELGFSSTAPNRNYIRTVRVCV
jgi:hypothetical protein